MSAKYKYLAIFPQTPKGGLENNLFNVLISNRLILSPLWGAGGKTSQMPFGRHIDIHRISHLLPT
jgi:hypothetical protein